MMRAWMKTSMQCGVFEFCQRQASHTQNTKVIYSSVKRRVEYAWLMTVQTLQLIDLPSHVQLNVQRNKGRETTLEHCAAYVVLKFLIKRLIAQNECCFSK